MECQEKFSFKVIIEQVDSTESNNIEDFVTALNNSLPPKSYFLIV